MWKMYVDVIIGWKMAHIIIIAHGPTAIRVTLQNTSSTSQQWEELSSIFFFY